MATGIAIVVVCIGLALNIACMSYKYGKLEQRQIDDSRHTADAIHKLETTQNILFDQARQHTSDDQEHFVDNERHWSPDGRRWLDDRFKTMNDRFDVINDRFDKIETIILNRRESHVERLT